MGIHLDNQFQLTAADDPLIVLRAHHQYDCPASLIQVRLHSDPCTQTLVRLRPIPYHRVEPIGRLVERLYYLLSALEDGIYEAESVRDHDLSFKAWLKVRGGRLLEATTKKFQALDWFGRTLLSLRMSCGHDEHLLIHGHPDRVAAAQQQYPELPCKECYRVAVYHAAVATNQALQCATLQGSPKQIRWAEVLRAEKLRDVLALEYHWDEFLQELQNRKIYDADGFYLWWLKRHDTAKFWIDHCELELWSLLRLLQSMGY